MEEGRGQLRLSHLSDPLTVYVQWGCYSFPKLYTHVSSSWSKYPILESLSTSIHQQSGWGPSLLPLKQDERAHDEDVRWKSECRYVSEVIKRLPSITDRRLNSAPKDQTANTHPSLVSPPNYCTYSNTQLYTFPTSQTKPRSHAWHQFWPQEEVLVIRKWYFWLVWAQDTSWRWVIGIIERTVGQMSQGSRSISGH